MLDYSEIIGYRTLQNVLSLSRRVTVGRRRNVNFYEALTMFAITAER